MPVPRAISSWPARLSSSLAATAVRKGDDLREAAVAPAALLGQLESQRLLPFLPVWLPQRVQLEPSVLGSPSMHDTPGLVDQSVDQKDVSATHPHLHQIHRWHVARYGNVRLDTGGRRIRRRGRPRVAGARQRHLADPELLRPRDCRRHPSRLEAAGRVIAFVLDAKPSAAKAKPSRYALIHLE